MFRLGLVCGGGVTVARVNSLQDGLSNLLSVWVYVCQSLPVFVLLGKLWDKHFHAVSGVLNLCVIYVTIIF